MWILRDARPYKISLDSPTLLCNSVAAVSVIPGEPPRPPHQLFWVLSLWRAFLSLQKLKLQKSWWGPFWAALTFWDNILKAQVFEEPAPYEFDGYSSTIIKSSRLLSGSIFPVLKYHSSLVKCAFFLLCTTSLSRSSPISFPRWFDERIPESCIRHGIFQAWRLESRVLWSSFCIIYCIFLKWGGCSAGWWYLK